MGAFRIGVLGQRRNRAAEGLVQRDVGQCAVACGEVALQSGLRDGKVRAAMNGRVVAVLVKRGERVSAGQAVMTLEAMKMEHVHRAGIAGTVSAIDVAEGEQVAMGKIVVEIEGG